MKDQLVNDEVANKEKGGKLQKSSSDTEESSEKSNNLEKEEIFYFEF